MKKTIFNNIENGLYELEIKIPNENLIRGIYPTINLYDERLIEYMVDDACDFTGILLIVKAQRGKNYVVEINTNKRIPIAIIEKNSYLEHGYPPHYYDYRVKEKYMKEHSFYKLSYDKCYKKNGCVFPYFVVAMYEHTSVLTKDITAEKFNVSTHNHSELYFVDSNYSRASNLFSYGDSDFKKILDYYTRPQGKEKSIAAINKLNEYEARLTQRLTQRHRYENISSPFGKNIVFQDANKIDAYFKYFKKPKRK